VCVCVCVCVTVFMWLVWYSEEDNTWFPLLPQKKHKVLIILGLATVRLFSMCAPGDRWVCYHLGPGERRMRLETPICISSLKQDFFSFLSDVLVSFPPKGQAGQCPSIKLQGSWPLSGSLQVGCVFGAFWGSFPLTLHRCLPSTHVSGHSCDR
jgi:hypothetical protein